MLPEDVELESRRTYRTLETFNPATEFGNDCDAWANYVEEEMNAGGDWPDCHASARLAEEWMEHYHGQPEHYFMQTC